MVSDFSIKSVICDTGVNYNLLGESDWVAKQLSAIINIDNQKLTEKAQFAFWINIYNLITLKSAIIKIGNNPSWSGNTSSWSKISFFYLKKHRIGGQRLSLYQIENKILRKKFKDPRLHFVINCASISCPRIPEVLLTENNLEEVLEYSTKNFINKQGVTVQGDIVYLSKIFKWYKNDFKAAGGVLEFINQYLEVDLPKNYQISYKQYDWKLNQVLII